MKRLPTADIYYLTLVALRVCYTLFLITYIKRASLKGFYYLTKPYIGLTLLTYLMYLPVVGIFSMSIKFILRTFFTGQAFIGLYRIDYREFTDPLVFLIFSISTALIIPVIEEIVMRGFVQNGVARFLGNKWGIVLSSIFFCLLHFNDNIGMNNVSVLVPTFIFSIFSGYLYHRTGSIIACIAMHLLNNSTSVIALFTMPKP
ncbi:CPBP family intramembrane metalloprotease [Chlamydiales bacterium]|nr:CPBP family intramembrane metalloprotease [Chlamydiales bacterium]